MAKFLGKGAEGLEQLAGIPLGGGVQRGNQVFIAPVGTGLELEVRGSKPPSADLGLKPETLGAWCSQRQYQSLETLPRFFHLPFLGSYTGLGTEAEPQPFPHASTTEHSQPPLTVPQKPFQVETILITPRRKKKGGSWRCSDLLPLHCREI